MKKVSVLFARSDSVYKRIEGCDVWDIERDARLYVGSDAVVCHPPCRAWGRLRTMAKPRGDEKELAFFALEQVRRCGGVLEHPSKSSFWNAAGLPLPGLQISGSRGYTVQVNQSWFGHRAEKSTWLYVVGVGEDELPVYDANLSYPTHIIGNTKGVKKGDTGWRPEVSKAEREHSPERFARWLVEIARRV